MKPEERDSLLDALFAQAKEMTPPQQENFLAEACDDEQLRREVIALLAAFRDAPKSDVANPILPKNEIIRGYDAASVSDTEPAGLAIGTKFGKYKLLQKLGEGGMGFVYMAEQTKPVARRVALKIIRPGMDSREILARFEAERQALAMMDHPNIAKVLDAGATENGLPYFVMELVKGVPVTEYCDEKRLPTKKRLELFISICHAVGHAHQKGVIHRDIKPTNVLVAEYDNEPVPKIIDFGVAKATTHRLTERTLITNYGQIVGTLDYMSPEQARFNQLDIDTRSDIYSLGVLMYELLVGTPPFDRERLRTGALDEVLRIIREEEPPKPSTKSTGSGQSSLCASNRRIEPAKLARLIRGDLDWIVMKAIAKERSERYQTATDFSADIERYLRDEPIEARRPSAVGRARRFIRRHRLPVALGSLAAMAVVAALFSVAFAWNAGVREELLEKQKELLDEKLRISNREVDLNARRLKQEEIFRRTTTAAAIAPDQPRRSNRLAVEAVELNRELEGPLLPSVHQVIENAVQRLGGSQVLSKDIGLTDVTIQQEWLIAVGDGKLHLWDVRVDNPGSTYRVVGGQSDPIQTMEVSHDGRILVTSGKRLLYWNLEELRSSMEPIQLADDIEVGLLSLSPKGRNLVASTGRGVLLMWDLTTPNQMPRVLGETVAELESLLTGIDSRYVALQYPEVTQLWNTELEEPSSAPITLTSSEHEKFPARMISPSGRWLVSDVDGASWLWDLSSSDPSKSPRVIHYPELGQWWPTTVSANDRWLISTEHVSGLIHKVDLSMLQDDSQPKASILTGHTNMLLTFATDETGNVLASAGHDGTVRIWDLRPGKSAAPVHVLQGSDIGTKIYHTALASHGRWVAALGNDSILRLWDLRTNNAAYSGLVLQVPESERIPLSQLKVSSDGRWIARSAGGKSSWTTRLWRVPLRPDMWSSEVDVFSFTGKLGDISGDDHWIVISNPDETFSLGDLKSKNPVQNQQLLGTPVTDSDAIHPATFAGSGRFIFAGGTELRAWDLAAAPKLSELKLPTTHKKHVVHLTKSSGGDYVISHDEDQMYVWDIDGLGRRAPRRISVGFDGDQIPSCSPHVLVSAEPEKDSEKSGQVLLWDLTPSKFLSTPRVIEKPVNAANKRVWLVRVSPDGRWLFTCPYYGRALLWDLREANPQPRELKNVHGTQWATFSPDGRWLATANPHGSAQLWDLTAPDIQSSIRILRGHDGPIWAVAFSGNSKWLVTDSTDGTVRRWNLDADWLIEYSQMR